jgi:predicted acylesterase/phospholipase RssA
MLASGMPVSTMETVATTMSDWRKLVSVRLTRMGFISSERIAEFMREILGDLSFEDLNLPTAVVATDLVTGDKKVFRAGPLAIAVRASCSIPQIYLPVEIDNQYYVDGGLAEYLPVQTAMELGADFVIASHLAPSIRRIAPAEHSAARGANHRAHRAQELSGVGTPGEFRHSSMSAHTGVRSSLHAEEISRSGRHRAPRRPLRNESRAAESGQNSRIVTSNE